VTKFFDTSSIPDTKAYWDALTRRVGRAAQPRRSALSWLGAERSAWLAAACFVALAAVATMSGGGGVIEGAMTPQVALTPRDALGRIFARAVSPPAIAELAALLPRDKGESP
jgi:hypothetical protein